MQRQFFLGSWLQTALTTTHPEHQGCAWGSKTTFQNRARTEFYLHTALQTQSRLLHTYLISSKSSAVQKEQLHVKFQTKPQLIHTAHHKNHGISLKWCYKGNAAHRGLFTHHIPPWISDSRTFHVLICYKALPSESHCTNTQLLAFLFLSVAQAAFPWLQC